MFITAIQCPYCYQAIFSRTTDETNYCTCGQCSIGGGLAFCKISWAKGKFGVEAQLQIELILKDVNEKTLFKDWKDNLDKFGCVDLDGRLNENETYELSCGKLISTR